MSSIAPIDPQSPATATWSRWIARRLLLMAVIAFLVALVFAMIESDRNQSYWLFEEKWLLPGGWLTHSNMQPRGERIWAIGCAIGLFLPDIRFSTTRKHLLLGGLIGVPTGMFACGLIDDLGESIAAKRAGDRVVEARANPQNRGPKVHAGYYKSFYRERYCSAMVVGGIVGMIIGMGWAKIGWRRISCWLMATLFATYFGFLQWSHDAPLFDQFFEQLRTTLERRDG